MKHLPKCSEISPIWPVIHRKNLTEINNTRGTIVVTGSQSPCNHPEVTSKNVICNS